MALILLCEEDIDPNGSDVRCVRDDRPTKTQMTIGDHLVGWATTRAEVLKAVGTGGFSNQPNCPGPNLPPKTLGSWAPGTKLTNLRFKI